MNRHSAGKAAVRRVVPFEPERLHCVDVPPCPTWRTADGRVMRICEMSYTHLCNSIRYLARRTAALARLGRPHDALHEEVGLMLLIAERGKRNNNPHALQTWCEAVDKWEALEDDDLMESVFGFEWKWGLG